jgi:hypothetical protein
MWTQMSMDEYAEFNKAMRVKLRQEKNTWWQQQHYFFYRPLFPFLELTSRDMDEHPRCLGAVQHAVPQGEPSNSYMNFIVFKQLDSYHINGLPKVNRKRIRKASRHLTIRPIVDPEEFISHGYPVYLSFYKRTLYSYKSDRRNPETFAWWARTFFHFPKVVILGAYCQNRLLKIHISCLVEDTLFQLTSINCSEALELHAPDLMLHTIREHAAKQKEIKRIFCGLLAQKESLNRFKIQRGACVLVKPAYLHLNRGFLSLIKLARKNLYDRLIGLDEGQIENKMKTAMSGKML